MLTYLLRQMRLAALAAVVLALPLWAAPVLKTAPAFSLDKYLLDDSDGVLVVNVKTIMESPAFKKAFAKQVADLVARPEAQQYLKDIGFDPLKDVEQMIICSSKSCYRKDNSKDDRDDGPFVLFQGKFDSNKLKAKMEALAKDHPDKVSSSDAPGGKKIYRIDPKNGPYAAQLDARTVVIAGKKAHVLDAMLKAAGKKTTSIVFKEASAQLKKFNPDVAVQGFALEPFVMSSHYTNTDDGMGKRTFKRTDITLADKGFAAATLRIVIKDDAHGSVVWMPRTRTRRRRQPTSLPRDWRKSARWDARRPRSNPSSRRWCAFSKA